MNTFEMQSIKIKISTMTPAELMSLNNYIALIYKSQQTKVAAKLSKGNKVSFQHKTFGEIIGTVEKVNRKTVSVKTEVGNWVVTPTLLTLMK